MFGKGRISEEQLLLQFHQTTSSLKIADEDLAKKQAKLLEEYFSFVQNQEQKIQNGKKKIQDMVNEMDHLRKLQNNQI